MTPARWRTANGDSRDKSPARFLSFPLMCLTVCLQRFTVAVRIYSSDTIFQLGILVLKAGGVELRLQCPTVYQESSGSVLPSMAGI